MPCRWLIYLTAIAMNANDSIVRRMREENEKQRAERRSDTYLREQKQYYYSSFLSLFYVRFVRVWVFFVGFQF